MELIHHAVRLRDVEMLRRELERGVDPDLRATDKTALQMLPRIPRSCSAQVMQCYRLLLENGADVNVRDSINDTLLMDASLYTSKK